MYDCGTCGDSFYNRDDREDHMDYGGHSPPECEICPRIFATWRACNQHMNDTDHWAPRYECETCTREFRSQNAVNQHMTAFGHWAPKFSCESCGRKFHTQRSASQHMDELEHWLPNIPCETCGQKFVNQNAADQHMQQMAHYKNYCKECSRVFQNENNLRMHLNSKAHRGTNVVCPFCKPNYTSASGLLHHLERGACPGAPTLNREKMLKIVRERDPHGVITNKQIEWHKEENSTYSANSRAFNGNCWECYVCHKGFATVHGLNAHLNSPVHKQKVYHCPNLQSRCGMQFATLAAFFNHLESEKCGFMRFDNVQRQAGNVLRGNRLIAF